MYFCNSLIVRLKHWMNGSKNRLTERYQSRPLNDVYYIEYLAGNGEVREQRVEAQHLTEKDGQLYIYGWCVRLPCFRAVPVSRITMLSNNDSGELVPRSDVAAWLRKRSLH